MKSFTLLAAFLPVLAVPVVAEAKTTKCKISVVGGKFKGRTYSLKMKDGKFVDNSGTESSNLPGCVAKKYLYGRWYHVCQNSKIIVYRPEETHPEGWKRLAAKNLKKYKHNCL